MRKKTFRITDPNEAAVLAQVELRRVLPHELAQCQQEVSENHYLKNAHLVGEQLCYVAKYERKVDPCCLLPGDQVQDLWQVLHQQVPESRNVHGLRHKQATVLAIVFAYLLSGGQGGHRGVALFAKDLSPTQRATFRCWFNRRTRRYDVPTENCIYRVLKEVPVLAFQQAIWAWQKARLGSDDGDVLVLDGKAVRGSRGTQLVGAINARSGRTLGVQAVAHKSNEIPAGQTLLERLDLDGTIALMDALHTRSRNRLDHYQPDGRSSGCGTLVGTGQAVLDH